MTPQTLAELEREAAALRHDIDDASREIAALVERHQAVLADTAAAAASLAAIRASNSWRAFEALRRAKLRLRGARMRMRGAGGGTLRDPAVVPPWVPTGVNVAGYLTGESGLGDVARATISSLEQARVPVALRNVDAATIRATDRTYQGFVEANPYAINLIHLNADNMEAFAARYGNSYYRDRYTVAFWYWELSRFRGDWMHAFDRLHEVWVGSRFVQACLEPVSPVPVVHLPPPLPSLVPPARGRAHFGIPAGPRVLLFTFDVSSQLERKNPGAVVRAFRRAGLARDEAILVLKFTNGAFDREAVRRLHEKASGLNVLMLDGYLDKSDVVALLNTADCYISLHRSEGFGRAMAESMALGKPVIATGYSGNLDFMTAENSYLVPYRLIPLTRDLGPYLRGFEWADADVDAAAEYIREVVRAPQAAAARAERGRHEVNTILGRDQAAARIRAHIASIERRLGRTPAAGGGLA